MEFMISTAKCWYRDKDEVDRLKALGFEFEEESESNWAIQDGPIAIEVESLQDLLDLCEKFGDIIIDNDRTLVIYNDYLE